MGEAAPDFRLVDRKLQTRTLADYAGKVKIISVVPSLDTPVCDTQTRRFNADAAALGDDVVVLTVSMDLPFAQARWCGQAGLDQVITLSDHRDASFGQAYGTLMTDLRLEARSVFVADRNNRLVHVEYVPNIGQQPDYEAALAAARSVL